MPVSPLIGGYKMRESTTLLLFYSIILCTERVTSNHRQRYEKQAVFYRYGRIYYWSDLNFLCAARVHRVPGSFSDNPFREGCQALGSPLPSDKQQARYIDETTS